MNETKQWADFLQADDPRQWSRQVREGIAVYSAVRVMQENDIRKGVYAAILGISERKWSRLRERADTARLNATESDSFLRLIRVLDEAKTVFASVDSARDWLRTANRALGGAAPLSMLDNSRGLEEVHTVLNRIKYGIYS